MSRKSDILSKKENKTVPFESYDEQIAKMVLQKELDLEKSLTSNDPNAILKAQLYLKKQQENKKSPDLKSWMFLPDDYMYTGNGYKQSMKEISFEVLRRMGDTFVAKLVKQARIDQVSNFLKFSLDDQMEGYTVRKKRGLFDQEFAEMTTSDKRKAEYIVNFLEHGGLNEKWELTDDLEAFIRKILDDSLTYDQLAFEIVRNRKGDLAKHTAVDASLIRLLDSNDPRYKDAFKNAEVNGFMPMYGMVWEGRILDHPVTGQPIIYYPWELGFGVRNRSSSVRKNGYGTSELEVAVQIVTWILWSFQYNGNFFKQGSQPKGFLNIKNGNGDNTVVNELRQSWRQMMSGVENCLVGDSFILTPEGRRELKSFFVENSEDKKVQIWTGKKFEDGLVYKTKEKKRLNRTTLNNGMFIESSSEHRFKTVDEVGDIVWKIQSELKAGDYLMVNKVTPPNKDLIYYNGFEVESDLFELIGWLTGDGYICTGEKNTKASCLFYHQKKERNIQIYHSWILDKYNINNSPTESFYSEEKKQRLKEKHGFKTVADSTLRTNIADIQFLSFLFELGFSPSKKGKVIPDFLFTCNPKYRRAFLRGFFSADGNVVGGRYIQMTISSDILRQRTKELLLSDGIRCSSFEGIDHIDNFTEKNKSKYCLLVRDNDMFFERVGMIQEHKQFKKKDFKYYSVHDSLPPSLCKKEFSLFREDLKLRYKETKKTLCNTMVTDTISAVLSDREILSFNRFKHVYDVVEDKLYKYEMNQEILNFHFEKIVKIESFEEEVEMFDVQIFDDENQFIVNGVLTHNSHKIPVFEGIDLEWTDLQVSNRDMEFNAWMEFLLVVFCSVYRIDPSELGFHFKGQADAFGQKGEKERLQHSKEKGLKPLLGFLQKLINKYIVSEIDEEFEFAFTGVDIEDEQAQVELDTKKVSGGLISFESAFEKYMGRPYDEKKDTILNPQFLQILQMKQMGGQGMNEEVDNQARENGEEPFNPFDDFGKANDPFIMGLNHYINKTLTK